MTPGEEQVRGVIRAKRQAPKGCVYVELDCWERPLLADSMDEGLLIKFGKGHYHVEAISPELQEWSDDDKRWRKLHIGVLVPPYVAFSITEFLPLMVGVDYATRIGHLGRSLAPTITDILENHGVLKFARNQKIIVLEDSTRYNADCTISGWQIEGGYLHEA